MNNTINIFNNVDDDSPSTQHLQNWLKLVLDQEQQAGTVNLAIVSAAEIQDLNQQYRHHHKPTNVLSFPFEPDALTQNETLIGDIVICAEVVNNEAEAQQKQAAAHWAHMCVHGCLHLLGYDHLSETEAQIMEPLEIHYLQELGFNNPYA